MTGAVADPDRLVAAGDLAGAAAVLEATLGPGSPTDAWLKLAGLRRALRQPQRALDAVHQALAVSPLDFVALIMRAGLLERLGDANAGEAWGEALAQRVPGELPPPLATAVAHGEEVHTAWLGAREAALGGRIESVLTEASQEEGARIARFASNALRKTRPYHSEPTHFHFPGLVEREFHPRSAFPWLAEVEAASAEIRDEMRAVIASERAELVPYLDYEAHEALAQWKPLNRHRDWTAVHLWQQGRRVDANANQCPRTMALLARLPQPDIPGASPNAMFSLLAPHTTIPPHVGVNNARLVCHLALDIPEGCWFRVGAETRDWREGEVFVFDDTIEHEAANPSARLRVVLIFDVWHPGLTEIEQRGAAAVVAGMGAPAGGL
ncbi:aspartyl/asparaginyl beta-hydroxylase domain-containing protein [Novosphingobium tardum]|uniref:Aspartyl/asparaginyl beta-hydroxylase domain-containing protein n=1 Tax=Novosphingobium tardum TaxID=1538021 RepID=A0ABV8RMU6_9SPHN